MKPTIFIASSSRDAKIVDALDGLLKERATVRKWIEGHEELGRDILEWAISEAQQCDFGLFVVSPDSRWGHKPNGNVLLECGLFIGNLGPDRCFILKTKGQEVPSDLKGRILAQYDAKEFERDGAAALEQACVAILGAVERRTKTLIDEIRGLWLERKDVGEAEGPFSLVEFDVKAGAPKVRGRSYDRDGVERVNWPNELSVCWIPPGRDELYHMFDARYGKTDRESALGVSVFKFLPNRQDGRGYYVVHGSGEIQEGAIRFELPRITKEYLGRLGLDPSPIALDDHGRCAALIRTLLGHTGRD